MAYQITNTNSGADLGTYDGADDDDAIFAMVKDAGYSSVADAASVCGQSVQDFLAELELTEVL